MSQRGVNAKQEPGTTKHPNPGGKGNQSMKKYLVNWGVRTRGGISWDAEFGDQAHEQANKLWATGGSLSQGSASHTGCSLACQGTVWSSITEVEAYVGRRQHRTLLQGRLEQRNFSNPTHTAYHFLLHPGKASFSLRKEGNYTKKETSVSKRWLGSSKDDSKKMQTQGGRLCGHRIQSSLPFPSTCFPISPPHLPPAPPAASSLLALLSRAHIRTAVLLRITPLHHRGCPSQLGSEEAASPATTPRAHHAAQCQAFLAPCPHPAAPCPSPFLWPSHSDNQGQ